MCVMYGRFGSKIRSKNLGGVPMGSVVLFILPPDCFYIPQGPELPECKLFVWI